MIPPAWNWAEADPVCRRLGDETARGIQADTRALRRKRWLIVSQLGCDQLSVNWQKGVSRSQRDAAWDALERFIHLLQEGRQVPDQYRGTLSALCEATGAQLAFMYSETVNRVLDMVGYPAPTPSWCRDFCRSRAAEMPQGGIWNAPLGVTPDPAHLEPLCAAILPVEIPGLAWLVALSFDSQRPIETNDLRVMRVLWGLQSSQNRHLALHNDLKEALFGIVRCLSTAIDAKDPCTCGHSERVARIAVRLGEEMKLPRSEISDLYLAGLLHDVGKIGIRDNVLLKEGPLTAEEYAHIQQHPVMGERIISNVSRLAYLAPAVRGHHERFDGKGYPDGLAAESIPPMARILAVADSCDAMMSARRYRPAISPEKIENIIREGAGTQWDPHIVDVFFACKNELYSVCVRGLGQSVYIAVERAAGSTAAANPHLHRSP